MPVGQRIKLLRERRGLSRAVVAGLCGRSESWLKKIEQGTRQAVRLPTLLRLAEVLRINDLTELTGQQLPRAVYGKPTHEATPTVQQALTSYSLSATAGGEKVGPPSTSELRRRLEDAFTLWRTSRYPRAEVGALLPALLIDAQYAVRELNGPDCRTAYAAPAGVYHLAQKLLAYQPVPELGFLAADRGMLAAQEADDPEAIAASAWYLAHVFREAGHLDQADRVVRDAATLLNPLSDNVTAEQLAMRGSLQLATGLTAACDYDFGTAWRFWDTADETARKLDPEYWHPWNGFGQVDMQVYGVSIDVTLGRHKDAARRFEAIDVTSIRSASERSRHLVEMARGYAGRRDDIAAVHLLLKAQQESPEMVKHGRFGRSIIRELRERGHSAVKGEVRALAEQAELPMS